MLCEACRSKGATGTCTPLGSPDGGDVVDSEDFAGDGSSVAEDASGLGLLFFRGPMPTRMRSTRSKGRCGSAISPPNLPRACDESVDTHLEHAQEGLR